MPDECYSDQVLYASDALSGLSQDQIKIILKLMKTKTRNDIANDNAIARDNFLK